MINITVDDPPEEIQSVRYRCDSTFELDQLEDMLIEKASYGLFVIDRSESCYGIASGKKYMFKNTYRLKFHQNTGEEGNQPKI